MNNIGYKRSNTPQFLEAVSVIDDIIDLLFNMMTMQFFLRTHYLRYLTSNIKRLYKKVYILYRNNLV